MVYIGSGLGSYVLPSGCMKEKADKFTLESDTEILDHPEAVVVGSLATTESNDDQLDCVPNKFKKWTHLMSNEAAKSLPGHKLYDHAIDLKQGEIPPWGPCCTHLEKELEVLREWLNEMLETGKIGRFISLALAPILLMPTAYGKGLRLCIDSRSINKITIANRYPLPIMTELQDRVRGRKIFTKIDLKNSYHLICINEVDECKTIFRCRYGLYKFLVMPFRLTNGPASFQDMMNRILKDLLHKGVVVYIDDILIYATNTEQHDKLVEEVLERLAKNDLVILPEKFVLAKKEVEFLGYIVTQDGMRMAKDKTEAIQDGQTPQLLRDVQSFLGLQMFIGNSYLDSPKIVAH
jgi:hypothetical protein